VDLLGHLLTAIQEFTVNCKQWDDMTAVWFPLSCYLPRSRFVPLSTHQTRNYFN